MDKSDLILSVETIYKTQSVFFEHAKPCNPISSDICQIYSVLHKSCPSEWKYFSPSFSGFFFLITKDGCGKLIKDDHSLFLYPDHLLFLDCSSPFQLETARANWDYTIFHVDGSPLHCYNQIFQEASSGMTVRISAHLSKLLAQLEAMKDLSTLSARLEISNLINQLAVICVLNGLPSIKQNHPSNKKIHYLEQICQLLETEFNKPHSLDSLESAFHVSKYRICREFHSAYHVTPLQYLNSKRIDEAKHLLITTDITIYEIGNMVGIDNPNHFIALFKRECGITPSQFRNSHR